MRLKRFKFNLQHDGEIEPTALRFGNSGSSSSSGIDANTLGSLIKQSADLNRTNTSGTYGSSTWSIDPTTGRYKQSVSLDPTQQGNLDTRNQIAEQMLGTAKGQASQLGGPFDYGSTVGDSATAGYNKAVSQLQPTFDQQNRAFDQTQADKGIPLGAEQYNRDQMNLQNSQNQQLNSAATNAVNSDNSQTLANRQQTYSDLANELATQNSQTPTAGTNAAIDTTGNYNTLNNYVSGLYNNANSKQQTGTSALFSLLGAFL